MSGAGCGVHCLAYQQDRECLIAGCGDGAVRLHFLDGRVPCVNDAPLPTELLGGWLLGGGRWSKWARRRRRGRHAGMAPTLVSACRRAGGYCGASRPAADAARCRAVLARAGHTGVVSGLALVTPTLLLSSGHDGSMRLWDLSTMKQLLVGGLWLVGWLVGWLLGCWLMGLGARCHHSGTGKGVACSRGNQAWAQARLYRLDAGLQHPSCSTNNRHRSRTPMRAAAPSLAWSGAPRAKRQPSAPRAARHTCGASSGLTNPGWLWSWTTPPTHSSSSRSRCPRRAAAARQAVPRRVGAPLLRM
jgi:hypothetical protein